MLFHPATIALNFASLAGALVLLGTAVFAVRVLRHWDVTSGSERQLRLERQTYLVSTLLGIVFVAELLSLVLFVFTAERLSVMFVGAMCAVGTLNASPYGFPALTLKIASFFAAGVWLVMNAIDSRGYDYPMVRAKYALLLAMAPLLLVTAWMQIRYFGDLDADVLTSCCSKIFSDGGETVAADMTALPPRPTLWALGGMFGLVAATGLWSRARAHALGQVAYAVFSAAFFVVALVAIVSAVAPYVYEQPHHHCPFCLLKAEYGYFGYLLYLPLFAGATLGIGVGPIQAFRHRDSLRKVIPAASRGLIGVSLLLFTAFGAAAAWAVAASALRM